MNLDEIITSAIAEDEGDGDHTTKSTIPPSAEGQAKLIIKAAGILCGMKVAEKVFFHVDRELVMSPFLNDGAKVKKGDVAFQVSGKVSSILLAERLVLNFMQRMSGIATATSRLVRLTAGFHAKILDTRKTTPLLRELEKYAVRTGGGMNHRMGLYDMIMIKDNHVDYAGGIAKAIDEVQRYLKENSKSLKVEIEVRNFTELQQVIDHGQVDRVMLDNFSVQDLKKALGMIAGSIETCLLYTSDAADE